MSILQALFGVAVAAIVFTVVPLLARRRAPAATPPPARRPRPDPQPSSSPASPFGYDNGVIIAGEEDTL